MVDVLLGLQWGDEGKGKIVDFLAKDYDIIARFQGGPNAGHTLYLGDKKVVLHTIPSGVFHSHCLNLIGNGVVIDPVTFQDEIKVIEALQKDVKDRLYISAKAHLILPTHRALDAMSETAKGKEKIGSTLKGIGPAYMDKTGRNGLRVGDVMTAGFDSKYLALREKHLKILGDSSKEVEWEEWESPFFESVKLLRELNIVDSEYWINDRLKEGKKVLAEGAQGSMLDIDFGTYPFVTSSNTTTAGVCTGLGIAPSYIDQIFGITKAYCTRVGGGPFPTELNDVVGEGIRKAGNEYGSTTGRARRCGWIDLVALKYATMLSGVTGLIITKVDVLDNFKEIKAATAYSVNGKKTQNMPYDLCDREIVPEYETFAGWQHSLSDCATMDDLPRAFKNYCEFIEQFTEVSVSYISNGTGRDQLIKLENNLSQ